MKNCSTFVIWINSHSKLQTVFSWFTLFWRNIGFVAIYALLCGAKMNWTFLSVEQEGQIWCMVVGWWCVRDVSQKYCHHNCKQINHKNFTKFTTKFGDSGNLCLFLAQNMSLNLVICLISHKILHNISHSI